MSRSKKKPIYKDKGIGKRLYWRTIRRVQKLALKQGKDIPNKRAIINDYDYCDYIVGLNGFINKKWYIKFSRK